jgi:hypothetical protein
VVLISPILQPQVLMGVQHVRLHAFQGYSVRSLDAFNKENSISNKR